MNIKDFKASLDYMFSAQLTPFVWGHAGVGKTESIKQYAKDKGYKFFALYLGTQSDSGDILGLYEFIRDREGKATSVDFAIPKYMKDIIDYCHSNPDSGAVLFLDEFNRARKDIMSGMFSLALDKMFHTIKLPSNCHLIAAGNPPTEEYVTTDVDEAALMARFVHIHLDPTFEEWVSYAKETEMEGSIVGFLREQPELLVDQRSAFSLPVKVDRRAWSRLNKLFKVNTPQNLLLQLMPGIVGYERTVAYEQHLKDTVNKPLTGEEVLTGQKISLLQTWCNPENLNMSLINISSENLGNTLQKLDRDLNDSEKQHLLEFLKLVPKDIFYAIAKKLVMPSKVCQAFKSFYDDSKYYEIISQLISTSKGK